MRNDNLTRRETADRSELVAVESYDVLLDLSSAPDPEADSFRSVTTVRFAADELFGEGDHWVMLGLFDSYLEEDA